MAKAFILGGSGFLGKKLTKELVRSPYDITALVHSNRNIGLHNSIKTINGSLETFDWKRLESDPPDIIFHAARMSGSNRKSRQLAAAKNARANSRLLAWLRNLDNPPLLVFVSGTLVYGTHDDQPVDEAQHPSPISFQREYFYAEQPVLHLQKNNQLPIIIVRPSWIYDHGSWFRAFYEKYMQKKAAVPIYGKGSNLMAFVHVRDAAAMTSHVAQFGEHGEIYNLYTEPAIRQREFAEMLAAQSRLPLRHVPHWWLKIRFDKAVSEAFSFSLNLRTHHQKIWKNYKFYYPKLNEWIENEFPI